MKKLFFTLFALLFMANAYCQEQPIINPSPSPTDTSDITPWASTNWRGGLNNALDPCFKIQNNTSLTATLSQASVTANTGNTFLLVRITFDWDVTVGTTSPTALNIVYSYNNTPVNVNVGTITTPGANAPGPATGSVAAGGVFILQPNLNTGTVPATQNAVFSVPLSSAPISGQQFTLSFNATSTGLLNIVAIRDIQIFLNAALPVTLEYFTGTNRQNNITLQWKTAMEENLDRYEIEQSRNGADFARIGVVAPHGIEKAYEFNNECALSGDVYYRLKSVDKDGKFEYSKTLNFKMESAGTVSIFPNPVIDMLSVQGNFSTDKTYQVRIINTLGQTLKMLDCTPTQDGVISVNQVDAFPKGVYMVEVVDKNVTTRAKFVH